MPTRSDVTTRFPTGRFSGGLAISAWAFVCVALAGCGKKSESRPDYPAQVLGVVTLQDRPLSTGTVTFIPDKEENEGGRPGIARIEADGSYRIGNANPDKPAGLPPGKYKVTVLVMKPDPTKTGYPVAELVIPDVYTDYVRTPFEVNVIAGANEHNFNLQR